MSFIDCALEVLPRDLTAYRAGNTGVDYVHRFESARPGPHVLVNALTHGNELCGMVAATHLLDAGVRPRVGTLTVSFANVAAYESFDASRPFDSRQLVHNLNRVWSGERLDGDEDSPELRRVRELRPFVAAADHILDLHSTSQEVEPFWVYPSFGRNAQAATAIGLPAVHLTMPRGLGAGTPLIQHGRHGDVSSDAGVAVVAECGQHFSRSSSEVAIEVSLRFLEYFGLIEREPALAALPKLPQRRYELLETYVIRTPDFHFARPVIGFETFERGELVATDGLEELRAPEACTILMPTRAPVVGHEGMYLARAL
ncbi:MAG TPA: succinylglutamate desuccinylase/aspartoacylase family protein [Ramlibacter sp.]|nr:succinylglutamate desuccinylase/aspartoacylase family protein [Ramlibacter sp.]